MAEAQRKTEVAHKSRRKRSEIRRVKITVHEDDIALMHQIVNALADPKRQSEVRSWLRRASATAEPLASRLC